MRRGKWLGAGIVVSALAFAGAAGAQTRGPGPFAGSFSVSSNTTVSVTSPMAITEERTTRERLEIGQGSRSDLSVQVTNDLGEHCTLSANRSGSAGLSFGSGQRCTFTDSVRNMRMNFTLRSGSGSISGDRLSLSFSWSVATDGGFLSVSGSASQRSSGNRTGGHAVAEADAPPVGVVAPPEPVAIAPMPAMATTPAVAPMMPMTGAPPRTPARRASSTPTRPRTTPAPSLTPPRPATPTVAVAPVSAPVPASAWGVPGAAVAPTPVVAIAPTPTSAWGSPNPTVPTAASAWTTPASACGVTGTPAPMPLPIDAATPGAIVHSSGWILGPLVSSVVAAAPTVVQGVSAWTTPVAPSPSANAVPWVGVRPAATPTPAAAWAPAASGPGVVLGVPGSSSSQGFGVSVGTPSPRANQPQSMPPNAVGPGIVFGASP